MRSKIYQLVLMALMLVIPSRVDAQNYIIDAKERVQSADWSQMEIVTVKLTEFAYSPETLVFKEGLPYKLEIKNEGTTKHYFTAEEFFKAIATRKIQSNADGEIKAPYFTAIEVFPGRSLDLYFVAVKKGNYDLLCTIKGHADNGMVGQIRIE